MNIDIRHAEWAGMPAICLMGSAGDSAIILLHGAQLVDWSSARQNSWFAGGAYTPLQASPLTCHTPLGLIRQDAAAVVMHLPSWELQDSWFHYGVPHAELQLNTRDPAQPLWHRTALQAKLLITLDKTGLAMALEVRNEGLEAQALVAFDQNEGLLAPGESLRRDFLSSRAELQARRQRMDTLAQLALPI